MLTITRKIALLLLALLTCEVAHATSTINRTVPSQNSSLTSAVVRNNFVAAYNDVNNILGKFAGAVAPTNQTPLQDWVDTSASPVYKFKFWNQATATWVQWGSLNIVTGVFSVTATSGSFAAAAPVSLSIVAGVATYGLNIDGNFAVSGSNLALASIASGHLIANCTGGSAEPGNCAWSTFADQAISSTNGAVPSRVGGSWSSILIGTSGGTIPLNNTANVFSALQSIITSATTIPAADTGALLSLANVDGTVTRVELTSAGANAAFSGRTSLGTMAVPLTLTSGTLMSTFSAHGYDGTSWATTANGAFRVYAEGTWSNTSHPTESCMSTTPSASTTIADAWCVHATGGATLGAPTGGDQGAGKINVSGGVFLNGVSVSALSSISGLGTGVATALGTNVGSAGALVVNGGALGTPSSGTVSTGVSLGTVTTVLGSDATGDIYYRNSGSLLTRLGIGGSGNVLVVSGGIPAWSSVAGTGTVTQVVCGTGLDGGTITTSGTCSLSAARRTLPTRQIFLSGTAATYTTPANALWLRIRIVGGGGGGCGSGTSPGAATAGTSSTFTGSGSTSTTLTGTAGTNCVSNAAGLGAIATGGATDVLLTGSNGGPGSGSTQSNGGNGGISCYGGGGIGGVAGGGGGTAGGPNSGSGGGGGGVNATVLGGGGGASGACAERLQLSPAATYTYTVGAGGSAGTAGTGGAGGGAGAAGIIIVEEFYDS